MSHVRRAAAAVLAAGLLAAAAGCGSNSTGTTSSGSSAPGTGRPANTLDVRALDYSYQITGAPHAGLVHVTFANQGKDTHEMGVAKLMPGVTLDQVKAAITGPNGEEAAAKLIDNPDAEYPVPATLGAGMSTEVTSTLTAGHYVVVCFLPGPDGMPHVAMGMIGEFTVSPSSGADLPPATQGTVELTDAGIDVPANFAEGGTFAVKNTGASPHDFSLAKLAAPGSLTTYFQCVSGSFEKSTPVDGCAGTLAGGVETLAPDATAYLTVHLPAGSYAYVSTQGEGKDFQAGLHGEFTIS